MPKLKGLLETALFVEDPLRAAGFYEGVLGLEKFRSDERGCAFVLPGEQVLLLVKHGVTREPNTTPGGVVPSCGASGSMHLAFAIADSELESWKTHLEARSVEIESEVAWERGGCSLYFRDPDGHLLELATLAISGLRSAIQAEASRETQQNKKAL